MSRLLFVVNDADFFLSHRVAIARTALAAGHEVHVAAPPGPAAQELSAAGMVFQPLVMSRRGLRPVAELRTLLELVRLFRRLRPEIVHLVTMKPVLYGGIAARLCRVPAVVMAIAGMGYLSDRSERRSGALRALVLPLMRFGFAHPNLRAIFQNPHDRESLKAALRLRDDQTVLIRGSGIELDVYRALPEPEPPITVTFASRLLRPKGICEFVAAAERLRDRGLDLRFLVAGDIDEGNPLTVTPEDLARWRAEGHVEVLGRRNDIAVLFAASHIVVLPSYYGEGLPKVLLEAAACGRAVVTTDHPGCRDAVVEGETGLLVPIKDASRLADAIERLMLDEDRRRAMGRAARQFAEKEFGIEQVVEAHLAVYAALLQGR